MIKIEIINNLRYISWFKFKLFRLSINCFTDYGNETFLYFRYKQLYIKLSTCGNFIGKL